MSKKTFLPQEWENAPSNHVVTTPMHPASTYSNLEEDVERIVHEIEKQGIDISRLQTMARPGFCPCGWIGRNGKKLLSPY